MEFKKNKKLTANVSSSEREKDVRKTNLQGTVEPKDVKKSRPRKGTSSAAKPVTEIEVTKPLEEKNPKGRKKTKAETAKKKKESKQEAKVRKAEAKRKKQEAKKQKRAEKKAKQYEKRGGKPPLLTRAWNAVWKALGDAAASWIFVHDKIQAKIDRFFAALLYSIVYEINDIRNRYKQNYVSMLTTFFSAIVVICMMLLVFNHEIAYQYSYNGRVLGYVSDQEQVNNILEVAGEKLSELNNAKIKFSIGQNITFKQVPTSGKDVDSADQVLNKLTYMTEIDVQAYGIYEDDMLKAVVESKSKAESTLNAVISHYRTPDNGMTIDSIKYKNSVDVREVHVMLTSVMTQSEAEDMLINGGTMKIDHIVMEDETESSLEETYGVDKDQIILVEDESEDVIDEGDATSDTSSSTQADNENTAAEAAGDGSAESGASSGDKIEITQKVDPIVVTMTESGTMSEVIKYKTVKKKTKSMYKGDTEVIQKGVNGRQTITGTLVYENGKEVSRDIESKEVLKKSVDKIMLVGTNDRPKWLPTGTYIIPVKNEVITSYFGSRWGRIHGGLDFGMPTGTPIYASDGGTVTRASYYAGYGLCIDVEHDGGTFTRYGHCSSVCVSVGDKVAQGEKIGEVGNTGNSTGSHLHFEIHPGGGSYVDPYPYLYGSNKGNSKNYE